MNPNPDKLEKAIHQTLRSLPDRKAPSALQTRILAEIARREALPWWSRSWAFWPTSVRWAFIVLSAGLCAVAMGGCVALVRGTWLGFLGRILARPAEIAAGLGSAFRATVGVAGELFGLIPPVWLYGGVATITLLYATVFLVGAAAYRTLWQPR